LEKFPHLFSPLAIKSLKLKNRFVMSPMETKQANPDGSVSDGVVAYYRRRAMGGVGLIMVEASYVHPTGKGFPTQIGIDRDELIPGLSRIPEAVHPFGTKVAVQLIHHGRQTESQVLGGVQPVSASPLPYVGGEVPRALEEAEIEELIQAFATACQRAKLAGFDAAEIHSAHGYLIQTFLSPHSNQRTDRYGNDLEGRMRFAVEVIRRSRETVGPDFPLFTRVSHREDHDGGYEVDYMEQVVPRLIEAGIDVLDVSVGNYNSVSGITIPAMDHPMGLNVEGASRLRRAAGVPTIVVGRLNDPAMAEQVLADHKADLIALGRQMLADPDYVTKIETGRLEDIRYCLACNDGCLVRMVREDRVSCSINPECTRELEFDTTPTSRAQRIWVVGGGPAGLAAAYYSALKGHAVVLWEKEDQLGGQWIAACKPRNKGHMRRLIDFYKTQLDKLGVEVKLGASLDRETLAGGDVDFAVLATGAIPSQIPISSDDTVPMVQAVDVLLDQAKPGQHVVVVGASLTGLEVADYLTETSENITIIEALEKAPVGRRHPHGRFLYARLAASKVALHLNARLEKIEKGGVFYSSGDKIQAVENVDTLVLAIGSRSNDSLKSLLDDLNIPYRIIGDASKPRNLHEAIREGALIADVTRDAGRTGDLCQRLGEL